MLACNIASIHEQTNSRALVFAYNDEGTTKSERFTLSLHQPVSIMHIVGGHLSDGKGTRVVRNRNITLQTWP